jgi:hypothetical protein
MHLPMSFWTSCFERDCLLPELGHGRSCGGPARLKQSGRCRNDAKRECEARRVLSFLKLDRKADACGTRRPI